MFYKNALHENVSYLFSNILSLQLSLENMADVSQASSNKSTYSIYDVHC